MSEKITVLVIGSTGMLGTKIVNALLDKGETGVKAMVRPNSYEKEDKSGNIDGLKDKGAIILKGYLMQPNTLLSICEGVDVVVSIVGNSKVTVPEQITVKQYIISSKQYYRQNPLHN